MLLVKMTVHLRALEAVLVAMAALVVVHLVRVTVKMDAPMDVKVTAVKHVVVDALISVPVVMLDALVVVVLAPVNVIRHAVLLVVNLVNLHAPRHV